MSTEYPNKCCRCGLCCLSETCPIGQVMFQVDKDKLCPGLTFWQGQASCALAERGLVPVGDGCCIKARAYKNGVEYSFADLPDQLKMDVARDMLHLSMRKNATQK